MAKTFPLGVKPFRFQVVCSACYTCVVGQTNNRNEANRMATGHLNAYGHNVTILDAKKETSR